MSDDEIGPGTQQSNGGIARNTFTALPPFTRKAKEERGRTCRITAPRDREGKKGASLSHDEMRQAGSSSSPPSWLALELAPRE